MSINVPGWCCCQEIRMHDKVFCKFGTEERIADARPLRFALSFWQRQYLAARACGRQEAGKNALQQGSKAALG